MCFHKCTRLFPRKCRFSEGRKLAFRVLNEKARKTQKDHAETPDVKALDERQDGEKHEEEGFH